MRPDPRLMKWKVENWAWSREDEEVIGWRSLMWKKRLVTEESSDGSQGKVLK